LNTTQDTWDKTKFNWGSFGDDAIYKFLSANSTRWNNGDPTRQISIRGVKHRFHLLDDIRCPVPNKSYKDLTPKQIEIIYLKYPQARDDIRDEEKNYIYAKENLPNLREMFLADIKVWISLKTKKEKSPLFGMEPKKAYEGIMNGTIEIKHNDTFERNNIIRQEVILKRGIRIPEKILEDLRVETSLDDNKVLKQRMGRPLNSKPSLSEEKPSQPEAKSTLYPPKPSLNL